MNNLTKTFFLALVMVLTTFSLRAQSKWQQQKAQDATDKIAEALTLNEEMSAKVYDIHLASYVKLKELGNQEEEGTLAAAERKAQAKQVWKDNNAQIEAILDEELAEKYRTYRKSTWEAKQKN